MISIFELKHFITGIRIEVGIYKNHCFKPKDEKELKYLEYLNTSIQKTLKKLKDVSFIYYDSDTKEVDPVLTELVKKILRIAEFIEKTDTRDKDEKIRLLAILEEGINYLSSFNCLEKKVFACYK